MPAEKAAAIQTERVTPPQTNILMLHRTFYWGRVSSRWLLQESSLRVYDKVDGGDSYALEIAHSYSDTGLDDYANASPQSKWLWEYTSSASAETEPDNLIRLEPISDQDLRFFIESVAQAFLTDSDDSLADCREKFQSWMEDSLVGLTDSESARLRSACEDAISSGIFDEDEPLD